MVRTFTATVAALALSLQAATATPFSASVTSGEGGKAKSDNPGVVAFFVNQVATFIGFEAEHSADGVKKFKFYSDGQCENAKAADSETAEAQPAEKAEPTGPEPIYYGF